MTITAKFASICPCCNVRIVPGAKVEWSKGSPARHVSCATPLVGKSASTATASVASRIRPYRGKWTGCSCGSRTDSSDSLIPSPRNCASCEHDA